MANNRVPLSSLSDAILSAESARLTVLFKEFAKRNIDKQFTSSVRQRVILYKFIDRDQCILYIISVRKELRKHGLSESDLICDINQPRKDYRAELDKYNKNRRGRHK